MTEKDMTVKDLYESLKPLVEEYGDLEIRVSYDSGVVATGIKNKTPQLILQPITGYPFINLEGY